MDSLILKLSYIWLVGGLYNSVSRIPNAFKSCLGQWIHDKKLKTIAFFIIDRDVDENLKQKRAILRTSPYKYKYYIKIFMIIVLNINISVVGPSP